MFRIKLKALKKSRRFNDLNEAYSSLTFTLPLNVVIRGQSVFIAIFYIKSKVLMRTFIVFLKGVILNPDIKTLLPFTKIFKKYCCLYSNMPDVFFF